MWSIRNSQGKKISQGSVVLAKLKNETTKKKKGQRKEKGCKVEQRRFVEKTSIEDVYYMFKDLERKHWVNMKMQQEIKQHILKPKILKQLRFIVFHILLTSGFGIVVDWTRNSNTDLKFNHILIHLLKKWDDSSCKSRRNPVN